MADEDAFSAIRGKLGSKVEINIKKTEAGFEFEEGEYKERLSLEGCNDAPTTEPPASKDNNTLIIIIICVVVVVVLIVIIAIVVVSKKKGSKTIKKTKTAPPTVTPADVSI